jgi:transcriptional regulator with XRE-family HTH domain
VVTDLQLGTRIRSLRQARHLTLRDVAERAGVTENVNANHGDIPASVLFCLTPPSF